MELNSFTFLFLVLPIFLAAYFLMPARIRPLFLIAVGIFLYYWSEGPYAVLLPSLILLLVLAARRRGGERGKRGGRACAAAAMALLVGLFVYFKYGNFLAANFNSIRDLLSLPALRFTPIHLPLGVSFILFSAISCLVDAGRLPAGGKRPGLGSIALYVTLFPKLLTGPLIPYHHFRKLEAAWGITAQRLLFGMRRFILGLGKKVLVADILARSANAIFALPTDQLDAPLAWIGLAAFSLQIYFDFSGYSDMAIGLGAIIGFDFPENFRYPYASRSITEFWSRWHITLSQWLRDYLFLPLAYRILDRLKAERTLGLRSEHWSYLGATTLTMLVCGFWHGAGWTFAAWGLYHAAFMALEHLGLRRRLKRLPAPVQSLYALLAVSFGWVLFRSPTLGFAGAFFKALLGFGQGRGDLFLPAFYLDSEVIAAGLVALAGSLPLAPGLGELGGRLLGRWPEGKGRALRFSLAVGRLVYLSGVSLLSTLYLVGGTYHPFLYLRF